MTKNILIAAGGTGGHLFPALAVGKELEKKYNAKLFFIGTSYRIESIKIPEMNYPFFPTPINAFPGKNVKAIKWLVEFFQSVAIAKKVIKENKIDALICAGAYLCVPPAFAASKSKVPIFLMESNVNLGKANKMLLSRACKIFTSWEETSSYIPNKNKIILSGNPVRETILNLPDKASSLKKYGLEDKLTILIMGGSLGAKSINKAIANSLDKLKQENVNIIWQTGGSKNLEGINLSSDIPSNIKIIDFIDDMASVYSFVDIIVSRSGATAVSEISSVAKASILVPMGSAANNEQYLNAKNLEDRDAAILINDNNLENELFSAIKELINNETKRNQLSSNVGSFSKKNASATIADFIINNI